jgi:hypothetical protein
MTMRPRWISVVFCLVFTGALIAYSREKAASVTAQSSTPSARAPQSPAGPGEGEVLGTGDAIELAANYERQCSNEEKPSFNCEVLRSLLVVEVAMALQQIERSHDLRGTQEALAGLDLADEPEILIAACRILGHFPDTPGIAGKILPHLLESPYLEVQRVAAQLLSANPDPGFAEVGRLWIENHSELPRAGAYEEYPDFPSHYAAMGFPKYAGASWFPPADSDRSIGWSTKDDVGAVSRWFSEALHAEALDAEAWVQRGSEQAKLAFQTIDQSKIARMQQLMEKAAKGNQAAAAQLEKLQKEIDSAQQDVSASIEKGVDKVAVAPASSGPGARWIVAQKKGGRVSRLVLVYPVASLQRTVIQHVWDLVDYPSAWPKPKEL